MTRTYLGPTIPLSGPDAVPIAGQPAPRYEGPDRLTPAPPSGRLTDAPAFPQAAPHELTNPVQRGNLHHAMTTIRTKRTRVTAELDHWEELRLAGEAIKNRTLRNLDTHLLRLEESLSAAGTVVHWARDAAEANRIVTDLVKEALADEDVDYDGTGEVMAEVVKVKSMVTQEIGLNEALEAERVAAWETDLAEIIVQLGHDHPSHFLVPAIHRNRAEVREIFLDEMGNYGRPAPADLDAEPRNLAAAARLHLREKFLRAKVGISGANFAVAETGTLAVVESEGNGRMCLTLPQTLISIVGIEKVLPTFDDLEVFLQLLPRSSTAERMNPYTSLWTGPDPDGVDGPQKMHVVLLDNGRTRVLAEPQGRDALRCIRCSACLNVCPVYEKVGGHAYGSFYPGPIGSILTPQLRGTGSAIDKSLPFASSLCGACFDVCPVRIPIPDLLVHMRTKVVEDKKAEAAPEVRVEYRPRRQRLPKTRLSRTTSFSVGGAEGYMTSSEYEDGRLGELFLKLGKQGSTLAGVMDAFSIAISIAVQYGVPLETYVQKFTNLKFEPAGMTDDPDIRIAQSIMDYIFRRLALDYLSFDERSELGIYTAKERARYVETGSYLSEEDEAELIESESLKNDAVDDMRFDEAGPNQPTLITAQPDLSTAHTTAELMEKISGVSVDAPLCFTCGTKMRPSGSCYVCEGCGSTSGCS